MSDLISRSEVNDVIDELEVYTCGRLNTMKVEVSVLQLQRFINKLKNIPTAYSVDGVVEELEERADFLKDCTKYGNKNAKQQAESYNTMMMYEVADLVDDLIEIVKHGGVGTETETIRDKAVKWNNNSSKRVPYEFIDYVEGKREIGVSDDVCEWKVFDNSLTDEPQWVYETTCGKYVGEEHTSKAFVYCPYCSKKIKVVE